MEAKAVQKVLLSIFDAEASEAEAATKAALRGVVVALEETRKRLEEVHSDLSALSGEAAKIVMADARSAIESVLADRIGPALRDLAAAASGPTMEDFQLRESD